MTTRLDVEGLPGELDRFLGGFFRRGWRSEIKFDPVHNVLYLIVRLGDGRLSSDDRFFSLIACFVSARSAALRRSRGPRLRCELISPEGRDLSGDLDERTARYLVGGECVSGMQRRLTLLALRRRLVRRLLPDALLWATAYVFVVAVVGLPLVTAVWLGAGALLLQTIVVAALSRRRP
jgi:hypothetical protein